MTRLVPTGMGAAVLTAVLLGALTGCGSDGPDALEKELGRKCQGRVAADSVDVRLAEGAVGPGRLDRGREPSVLDDRSAGVRDPRVA
ncbi:hypothetical protein ACWDE9_37500, partial [Streptomyces olivaceoviridis]